MKKWWFSIFCYLMAVLLPIYTIVATLFFDEELLFISLVLISSICPTLMFIVIGVANQPQKENKDKWWKIMKQETKQTIKELLIYFDTQLNFDKGRYLNNDISASIKILHELGQKYPQLGNHKDRQQLIKDLIERIDKEN